MKSESFHSLSKIIILSFNEISWSTDDDLLLNYLSEDRRNKVLKYVHLHDRKASLYAAILARFELNRLIGVKNQNLHFSYSKYGKPFLSDYPNICFNISHSHNAILFAYTKSSDSRNEIGLDIEIVKKAPLSVMNSTFHKNETGYVYSDIHNVNNRFYTIWTRKEALFKLKGTGLTDNSLCETDTTKYDTNSIPSIFSSNCESDGNSYIFSIASYYPLSNYIIHNISFNDLINDVISK